MKSLQCSVKLTFQYLNTQRGNVDLDKIYDKIKELDWIRQDEEDETVMVQGKNPTDFNMKSDPMAVDQIFSHANAKTEILLQHIKRSLKQRAMELSEKDTIDLQKLVQDQNVSSKRELNWLLLQTKIFENPAKIREEQIRELCIEYGINHPIVGEE